MSSQKYRVRKDVGRKIILRIMRKFYDLGVRRYQKKVKGKLGKEQLFLKGIEVMLVDLFEIQILDHQIKFDDLVQRVVGLVWPKSLQLKYKPN